MQLCRSNTIGGLYETTVKIILKYLQKLTISQLMCCWEVFKFKFSFLKYLLERLSSLAYLKCVFLF